jgi:ketosteroid isomerase-like protein
MWKFRATTRNGSKRLLALGFLLLLAAGAAPPLSGMPRSERHEQRHEIDQMEDAWREAMLHADAATVGTMLADDYMGISPIGTLQSREQTLASLRAGLMRFKVLDFSDRKVRLYGTTAVVTSRAEVEGVSSDGPLSGSYRYTHVWVRNAQGVWKIVSFEASRIDEPHD